MSAKDDGYVTCGECGHAIEAHDRQGCVTGDCTCRESWTERDILAARKREGLPMSYNPWDI